MTSLLKAASKRINREQERIKQRYDKESHNDDDLKDQIDEFTMQQKMAERMLKEANSYLKAMQVAVDAAEHFSDAICAVYGTDWADADGVHSSIKGLVLVNKEWPKTFEDHVVAPLNAFLAKFPDIKSRIQRRERRQLDFSAARRAFEAAKEKQSTKLAQFEKEHQDAERQYQEVNSEVHEVVPAFNRSRVGVYGCLLQAHFAAQEHFHKNCREISARLCGHMDQLVGRESANPLISKPITTRRATAPASAIQKPVSAQGSNSSLKSGGGTSLSPPPAKPARVGTSTSQPLREDGEAEKLEDSDSDSQTQSPGSQRSGGVGSGSLAVSAGEAAAAAGPDAALLRPPQATSISGAASAANSRPVSADVSRLRLDNSRRSSGEGVSSAEPGSRASGIASDVLDLRVATHNYNGQDDDELSFKKGDIIERIPFQESDDEEEGWFNGRIGNRVGLFPANFTAPKL
eukprot:m.131600 g.131600  ORF g.131600 m.131600 type:complete len:461 (-) comp16465_c0_seq1:2093-3475(-)